MTKVTFYQNQEGQFTGFTAEGHSGRGFISFRLPEGCSRETEILLRSLALGLSEIESDETNQDYVDIIFEEV